MNAAELNPVIAGGLLGGGAGAGAGYVAAPEDQELIGSLVASIGGAAAGGAALRSAPALRKLRELQGSIVEHPSPIMHSWSQSRDNISSDPILRHLPTSRAYPVEIPRARENIVDLISNTKMDRTSRETSFATPSGPMRLYDNGRHFMLDIPTDSRDAAARKSYMLLRGNRHGLEASEGLRNIHDHGSLAGLDLDPRVRKQIRQILRDISL